MDVCYCGSLDLIRHPACIADWWRETCHTLYECDELIKRYGGRLKEWEIRGQCSQEPQAITCICVVCVLWLLWYLPLYLNKVRHTTTFHSIHFSPHWVTFSLNFAMTLKVWRVLLWYCWCILCSLKQDHVPCSPRFKGRFKLQDDSTNNKVPCDLKYKISHKTLFSPLWVCRVIILSERAGQSISVPCTFNQAGRNNQ